MKKEDIHLGDIRRILFGETPAVFTGEVFVRTLFIYLALMITVRLMGKRLSGQLTISEMAVMVTLGAIVAPAMQVPYIGLAQGVLVLACALVFQRGLNFYEFKNRELEKLTHGDIRLLVRDGEMVLEEMDRAHISRQQLFAVLRAQYIYNLGQVERLYLESFGLFSIYKRDVAGAGLSLLPPGDDDVQDIQVKVDEWVACTSCGHVRAQSDHDKPCEVCTSKNFSPAMLYPDPR